MTTPKEEFFKKLREKDKLEGHGTGTVTRNPNFGKEGKPLKTAKDIRGIKIPVGKDGEPVKIGGKHFGDVFIGKIHFEGEHRPKKPRGTTGVKKWHRVAIKRFHNNLTRELGGESYQETIEELRRHRVELPKMGMVQLPKGTKFGSEVLKEKEWVQISQLYGATKKGSKIHQKSYGFFPTKEGREFAVKELVKVASAGRLPADDLLEPVKIRGGESTIPFDIDQTTPEAYADIRALQLLESIGVYAKGPHEDKPNEKALTKKEYSRLYDVAMKEASPAMKKAMEKAQRRMILHGSELGKPQKSLKGRLMTEKKKAKIEKPKKKAVTPKRKKK